MRVIKAPCVHFFYVFFSEHDIVNGTAEMLLGRVVCVFTMSVAFDDFYVRFYTLEENTSVTFVQRSLYGRSANSDSEGSLGAEQIVNRFAENAGLDLNDVITNYTQYARAIQQSFASRGKVENSNGLDVQHF
jgi:hypothetical protein